MTMTTQTYPDETATKVTTDVTAATVTHQDGNDPTHGDARQAPAGKPVAAGILRLFKMRNFSLLFGGQTISTIGDALYMVALPWLILTTGGSAQDLGTVLAAFGIPRAASMLAGGWLSDRLRPRRLMLLADTARLLLMAILAALALGGHPTLWQLCAVAVPLGALGGAFMPAAMSILPDMLSKEDLQAGNGVMMASMQGALLVGSAVAGVIVAALSAGAALVIDAATFLVSAGSLALMRTVPHALPTSHIEKPSADAQEQGEQVSLLRFLGTSRLIQVTLLMFIVMSLVSGGLVEVALPVLLYGPLHGSARSFGVILAAWGAGALIGSIFAGTLGKRTHRWRIILLCGLIVSAAIGLLPVWGVLGAIGCMLVGGVANSFITVLLFTAVQLAIPRHLMGRVMGLLLFCSFGMYPLSVALAGVLANQFGPAILFPIGGLVLALALTFGMTQRALREM